MNNDKKPEKIEFKNNKVEKILIKIIVIAIISIILFTILYLYTPLKDILFKKEVAEETIEELTEETTIQEQTIQEPKEETSQETKITTEGKTTEDENEGIPTYAYSLFEHQGIVLDIDYEKYTIKIENANTGEIEELDCYRFIEKYGGDESALDVFYNFLDPSYNPSTGGFRLLERADFKDIKVGYYVAAYTTKDAGEKAIKFWQDDNLIITIHFSEERWW